MNFRPTSASQITLSGQKSTQINKIVRYLDVSNINVILSCSRCKEHLLTMKLIEKKEKREIYRTKKVTKIPAGIRTVRYYLMLLFRSIYNLPSDKEVDIRNVWASKDLVDLYRFCPLNVI